MLPFIPLTELIVTVLGGTVASVFYEALRRYLRSKNSSETLDDRVDKLTQSLKEATSLIDHIETEIKERSALAEKLRSDVDRYNRLKQMSEDDVEAIAQLLRGELQSEGKRSFWQGVTVNTIFFVLGAVGSFIIALVFAG